VLFKEYLARDVTDSHLLQIPRRGGRLRINYIENSSFRSADNFLFNATLRPQIPQKRADRDVGE